jgi:hypothetical protein
MSNQFLKLRRSAVPGKVPTTSSLDFGEIALNTYDGLLFIKKSGSLGEEIISIGGTGSNFVGAFTGSFTGSFFGVLEGTSSFALTASYALNAGVSNPGYQISSGSVTASVNVGYDGVFLIQSASNAFFEISGSSETSIYSDIFIIKNFTNKQPVLTISESVAQFATQSLDPVGSTNVGSIWFTATNLYVGLD